MAKTRSITSATRTSSGRLVVSGIVSSGTPPAVPHQREMVIDEQPHILGDELFDELARTFPAPACHRLGDGGPARRQFRR